MCSGCKPCACKNSQPHRKARAQTATAWISSKPWRSTSPLPQKYEHDAAQRPAAQINRSGPACELDAPVRRRFSHHNLYKGAGKVTSLRVLSHHPKEARSGATSYHAAFRHITSMVLRANPQCGTAKMRLYTRRCELTPPLVPDDCVIGGTGTAVLPCRKPCFQAGCCNRSRCGLRDEPQLGELFAWLPEHETYLQTAPLGRDGLCLQQQG